MHHPDEQCFVLEWQGQQARLEYQYQAQSATSQARVDFNHTFVPPEFRGQGLAAQLVQFGLCWAGQQHLQVTASCWYVAKVMRDNAEKAAANQAGSANHHKDLG
ncbi:N-acetyltransferase [Rheinheimera riviphila]|uniref:N-acetyltransferase n=2 Tax=Rheinheimera riviphila TaxID=1834037 RepID=A0A437QZW2_9GAMM|nr:N-acetyltransferase [Rheinheimera riviphila]